MRIKTKESMVMPCSVCGKDINTYAVGEGIELDFKGHKKECEQAVFGHFGSF